MGVATSHQLLEPFQLCPPPTQEGVRGDRGKLGGGGVELAWDRQVMGDGGCKIRVPTSLQMTVGSLWEGEVDL